MDASSKFKRSQYSWERFVSGFATANEAAFWHSELDRDSALRERYARDQQVKLKWSFEDLESRIAKEEQQETNSQLAFANPRKTLPPGRNPWWKMLWQPKLRPAWAMIAVLFCIFPVLLVYQNRLQTTLHTSQYNAKGESKFLLWSGEAFLPNTDTLSVQVGDSLSLAYISATPQFIQVWFRDDAGEFFSYLENGGEALRYEPVASAQILEQKLVLQGGWKIEELFLLSSNSTFSTITALKHLRVMGLSNSKTDTANNGISINRYILKLVKKQL